ncbi:unnamed protein product [Arctia plantaginis]|uniref:Uncharacterized protein n=1 Tax=Arctia plantaginis TaxID=874455 RepID=A0A8S0ZY36_ARCPL|nr:unnamed protein product [Arctia plantaginis]
MPQMSWQGGARQPQPLAQPHSCPYRLTKYDAGSGNGPVKHTTGGHLALNRQLFIINATDSPLCRGCLEAEETAVHVVLECEGVATQRASIIPDTKSLLEACERPRRLLRFWKELGWLT